MSEVASGAGDLPFYYYHIPKLTGVKLDMLQFLERGEARISIKWKYTKLLREYAACWLKRKHEVLGHLRGY